MTSPQNKSRDEIWPALPFSEWKETCATLHMWTQIVGKIRLALTPWTNHSWHVTLYVTARGLTTSPIPYGARIFEIEFDFIDHKLSIATTDGARREIPLLPRSVSPFERDEMHRAYDRDYANRFWRVLVQADRVFKEFRSRFCGKCSPVHFFWGSFDLAVTRFSGRAAPPHPGGIPHLPDSITREAYSQEVSSLGFWPGNVAAPMPLFYSYAYPEPSGFAQAKVVPEEASYNATMHEFILPYDAVRTADSPDAVLLEFAQSAYDAASTLGKWERDALKEVKPSLLSERRHL